MSAAPTNRSGAVTNTLSKAATNVTAAVPAAAATNGVAAVSPTAGVGKTVVVVPVKGPIEQALIYVIRRGVKEAQDKKADALVLDMDTNGGRVDSTEEILRILQRFPHQAQTYTLIDSKAFSAGAFISAGTRHIYMTPGAVIGAATPIMATGQEMPESVEEKMTSAVRGLVRSTAELHGHNVQVFDAMVDRTMGLTVDGKEIVAKGKILTLTANEATASYGNPPKPLLAHGIVGSLDELLVKSGLGGATIQRVEETGFEKMARWIVGISPILLLCGIVGIYVEMKTPGFGLPGIAGITCFAIFFFGHYVAGLSGHEVAVVFVIGLALVLVEVFVFPGTLLPGLAGATLIVISLAMAMVDKYPVDPVLPTMPQLQLPLQNLLLAMVGAAGVIAVLIRYLPESPVMKYIGLSATSGVAVVSASRVGETGVAATVLRPSGKALFGDRLEDVVTTGDMIEAGAPVRVVEVEGPRVAVERI